MLVYKIELLGISYVEPLQYNEMTNAVNEARKMAREWKDNSVNIYLVNVFRKTQRVIGVAKFDEKINEVVIKPPFKGR